ncbi:MAG: 3-hydroxyacyl-CoA dehydrogenase NAD-binding domain-containing protein, partial [Desulfurococcales archaeon]|nr:3-hydroxyacyl-CoA dehydrogenase NAD-binding domain-containing protein [Desulfurococcales archaeon]
MGVVGLGYVGLQSALLAASSGYRVIGVDLNEELVKRLSRGEPVLMERFVMENWRDDTLSRIEFTTSYEKLGEADVILVAVQTPIRNCEIDYSPLKRAGEGLAKVIRKGTLVVNESTIYPGGTRELLGQPIERHRGWKAGREFYLAHCPERVNPGDDVYTMRNIPRVLGAVDPESLSLAANYYKSLGL